MQNHSYDLLFAECSPVVIACAQGGRTQRVQDKMDELFSSQQNFNKDETQDQTMKLPATKAVTKTTTARRRRLTKTTAAGRTRRLEQEQTDSFRAKKKASRNTVFAIQSLALVSMLLIALVAMTYLRMF